MLGNLVPDELQNELMHIRDAETLNSWRVGDICEEVCQINMFNDSNASREDIYEAVGLFVGKARRTVREYHALANFYQPEYRKRFEVLAFDHFREASRLGPERAIAALEWAVSLVQPATVDQMIAKFAPEVPGEPEAPGVVQGSEIEHIYMTVLRQEGLIKGWLQIGDLPAAVRSSMEKYGQAAFELKGELLQMAAIQEAV